MSPSRSRVLVVGLDCATPDHVFDRFLPGLPALRDLVASGQWGRLESTIPPLRVPAWAAMMSGKDPGVLGVYGFRNRRDYSSGTERPHDWQCLEWLQDEEPGRPCL